MMMMMTNIYQEHIPREVLYIPPVQKYVENVSGRGAETRDRLRFLPLLVYAFTDVSLCCWFVSAV